MGRIRYTDSAAGQAVVLFVAAGTLGLVGELVPHATRADGMRAVNAIAVVFGLVTSRLPWSRWSPRATLALVPAAFALIVVGRCVDPSGGPLYGLWFVVVFGWVGSWHPPRTCLALAPVGALAYVVPFLPGSPASSPEALATVAIAVPIAVVLGEVLAAHGAAMQEAQAALETSAVMLERANLTDDLTGVGNRRRANSLLDMMRPGDGLALLDLDHFKRVNDTLGHAEGDRVLMALGAYLADSVRDADCVARFGGEEFLILLRGAGAEAGAVIERLVGGWRLGGIGVTLSAGVAVHVAGRSPTLTLQQADTLLYAAKAAGRDQVLTESAVHAALIGG